MDKDEYKTDYIDKRQEKRKEMSPEDKAKLFKKANRSQSRKNMAPKTTTQRLISIKAGRNRQRIEELESTVAILVAKIQNLESIVIPPPEPVEDKELPKAYKPIEGIEKKLLKEKCPTCGKEFKQLKRHKCKVKPKE